MLLNSPDQFQTQQPQAETATFLTATFVAAPGLCLPNPALHQLTSFLSHQLLDISGQRFLGPPAMGKRTLHRLGSPRLLKI